MQALEGKLKYGVIGIIGDSFITRISYSNAVGKSVIDYLLKNGIQHNFRLYQKTTVIEAIYPSLYHLRQAKNITQHNIIKVAMEKIHFNNTSI
jgi:hypothetical protein